MLLTEVSNVNVFTSSMELLSQSLVKEREGEGIALFTQRSSIIAAAALMSVCCQGVSPVSPVNLNLRTVYNHMDAVLMCSD